MSDRKIEIIAEKYLAKGEFASELRRHLYGTSRLAGELAALFNQPIDLAKDVGYWHDITRGWSDESSREFVRINRLTPDTEEMAQGSTLLHGGIAACLWQREFSSNVSIENALSSHTLGIDCPTIWDQIIAVADFAAYDRSEPYVNQIRRLALTDLTGAYLEVFRSKIDLLNNEGKHIHPRAVKTLIALQRSCYAG